MAMLLKMYIEDEELRSKYSDAINKHNNKMNNMYSDAGF